MLHTSKLTTNISYFKISYFKINYFL